MYQNLLKKKAARQLPSVLLWGGKSKARIVDEMLRESSTGLTKIIFDHTIKTAQFETLALFTNDLKILKKHIADVTHYVVCIGGENGYARLKTAEYLETVGLKPITLIHEKSFIEPTSKLGYACQVMPFAVIHKFTTIGNHTIINTNSTIDHECLIGNGVHIMGSAAIAGKVEIGNYATIGTNATILPYLKIGEGAFVGAGAVVTKDVAPYSIVAGIPAKPLRENNLEFSEKMLISLLS